jgi:nucleotide-binding universal stress UspA family protein
MYSKVLVPLDGSELAECALPEVKNLAKGGYIGEVILLNVVEPPSLWLAENLDIFELKRLEFNRAQEYVRDIQSRLASEGIPARAEVFEGRASHAIVEFANENAVDLIVIATHGYTGMKKLMFGSVALRVLHDSHAPVLLIRPESCRI